MTIAKGKIFLVQFIILMLMCACQPANQQKTDKLTIWHWMTDRQEAFDQLAAKYKEKTGIEVEFKQFFPPDIYSQKVIAAARAGNLPDIFGILGEKRTVASFIRAGHVLNLTKYMQENNNQWKDRFYENTLSVVVFPAGNQFNVEPGIYAVPIDTTVMHFVYNKDLLKQIGYDLPPKNIDEFIMMAEKVKGMDKISGFVSGWGEGWMLNALATEWAINIMGEDKFIRTLKGEIPYTDPKWIEVFKLFVRLRQSGILVNNIATMTNKEAEDAFAKGKALFSFNGSWAVNVYSKISSSISFGFFALPRASEIYPVKIWGGAGSSFMVNARSVNKEKAVDFLRWLTEPEQQKFLIKATNNLPSIKGCEEDLSDLLKEFIPSFDKLTHPDTWPVNEDSRVLEVMNQGLQQLILGIKSPEQLAEDIQKTKERIKSNGNNF